MSPIHSVQGESTPPPPYATQAPAPPYGTQAAAVAPTAPVTGPEQAGGLNAAAQAGSAVPAAGQPADSVTISPEAVKAQQGQAKPVAPPHNTYHPSRRS